MSLTSTLWTLHGRGVVVKTNDEDFNEAIHDAWEALGWEWGEVSKHVTMASGRYIPWVAEMFGSNFGVVGYEAEEPETHAFMYAAFNTDYAKAIADNISAGFMILAHEVEGNGTQYFVVRPGSVVLVDVVSTIVSHFGL